MANYVIKLLKGKSLTNLLNNENFSAYAKNVIFGEWGGRAVNTKVPEVSHQIYLHDIREKL